jgi:type IV pilus assembly protein PilY1
VKLILRTTKMNKLLKWVKLSTIFSVMLTYNNAFAATNLADAPIFATPNVPGNVALVISAEWPTGVSMSYKAAYNHTGADYVGYFDPKKCYSYLTTNGGHFHPVGAAVAHSCLASVGGRWSGNFLNWATTQTIDPLRYALTGGSRAVDTASLTILRKAAATNDASNNSYNTSRVDVANQITADPTLVSQVSPYAWNNLIVKVDGLGTRFQVSSLGLTITAGHNVNYTPVPRPANGYSTTIVTASATQPTTDNTATTGKRVYEFEGKVEVCNNAFPEANCVAYGANFKPEGLMQKNATRLNFASFGYLNRPFAATQQADGGVLRARMAALGPLKSSPGVPDITNPTPEWSAADGVFLANPATADATASGVTNSGVINYLNNFGYNSGYKTYDPVGELYYTAIRYFKNQGNVASYTAGATAAELDGFPAINFVAGNAADDPIKYSCQGNYAIGVGDLNAWADSNLPGSGLHGTLEAAVPAEVTADTSVNAQTATNKVGELQGMNLAAGSGGNLGERYVAYGARQNSYLIAGLAFDSHTKDMRPNKFIPTSGTKTKLQTLDTYWLDVLENNTDQINVGGAGFRNAYWLTAKYGGFDVPANYVPYATTNTVGPVQSSWDKDNNGDPDNYFRADNPANMIQNLKDAFADILSKANGTSKALAVENPLISTGDLLYSSGYSGTGWTGDVEAKKATVTAGVLTKTTVWNAVTKLTTQAAGGGWDTGRVIATANCAAATLGQKTCTAVPFRGTAINATMQANLGTNYANVVDYLRGDKSKEQGNPGGTFRVRTKILGDIVNSTVVAEGAPHQGYSDTYNPGYSAFKAAYASRVSVAYVGANDGMVHAFRGTETGGDEMFAYVPHELYAGGGLPAEKGLAALSSIYYIHNAYVDSTPKVTDVDFAAPNTTPNWHTILVGGLGKGGKAYYALDVTDPASITSETALSGKFLWEFSHQHLGYTYGKPLIAKTAKYGWVVILPSGYNNSDGKGYIFILRASDGYLIQEIPTNVGSPSNEAGLAQVNSFVSNYKNGLVDAVYAGDLLGNVWRFDLDKAGTLGTNTAGAYPTPVKIAQLQTGGIGQPITFAPAIEVDKATQKRYVFVSTGKLLANSDILDAQTQSFYAIADGTSNAFYNATTLPTPLIYPILRSNMNNNTSTLSDGIGANPANNGGWYVDFPVVGGISYKATTNFTTGLGTVAFAASRVTLDDPCEPASTFEGYALAYGTGKSNLRVNGASVPKYTSQGFANGTIGTQNYGSTESDLRFNTLDGSSEGGTLDTNSIIGYKPLNWREIPNVD